QRLEHSKMSHAAGCAASERQPDLNASQMMNYAFEPVLPESALVYSRSIKSKLKVSVGDFMQLWYIRRVWGLGVENPHKPNLFPPSGYTLLQALEHFYCGTCIFWPHAPKHDIDVTQNAHHCFLWVISTKIDEKAPMRGPLLQNPLPPFDRT